MCEHVDVTEPCQTPELDVKYTTISRVQYWGPLLSDIAICRIGCLVFRKRSEECRSSVLRLLYNSGCRKKHA